MNQPLKCPLCGGTIKKVAGKTPLIKCEKNIFENGQQQGCTFFMNLSPKPMNGYVFTKEEIKEMLEGKEVLHSDSGIKAKYTRGAKFNPELIFPALEDF
jgi:hypothetical protein